MTLLSDCCHAPAEKSNIGRPMAKLKQLYKCSKCEEIGAIYGNCSEDDLVILENDNGGKATACKNCKKVWANNC